ncbi:enoyl-CoA hydratase/isomerase family protein [Paraburkholderia rhynchosiae]|uniref:Enoyl-CoA hydratase n=1 Tax=Paraburkholderia rhynchosiae TaxID=487049 RepID=A0A2N7WEZ2_9BURK|nr:enoyl-CoA hydratase/isomerase family protein [Paraburkholderia rhynchosiae]PMS28016.1 enoyl-CoA hydratase [Paraburkholderia rhynchosiae]CAB3721959.1 Fatty acid oxidation complex subunit alpha [Paraburkholderia rhynchosiae]
MANIDTDPVRYACINGVATITIDSAPVNALSVAVRSGLLRAFAQARADENARAVVLTGRGKGFCAGGDIREFGTPAAATPPGLSIHVHPMIESMNKPVIAAIHGMAIGGGLETALVCHYRVVEADTRVGLPEVGLGTIPLSGTQRMPRALDLRRAIDMILSARMEPASAFAGTALFDQIVGHGQALASAMQLAHALIERNDVSLPLIRHLPVAINQTAEVLEEARAHLIGQEPGSAVRAQALAAIGAAVECVDFEAGMRTARAIYDALMASDEVRIQRERFLNRK